VQIGQRVAVEIVDEDVPPALTAQHAEDRRAAKPRVHGLAVARGDLPPALHDRLHDVSVIALHGVDHQSVGRREAAIGGRRQRDERIHVDRERREQRDDQAERPAGLHLSEDDAGVRDQRRRFSRTHIDALVQPGPVDAPPDLADEERHRGGDGETGSCHHRGGDRERVTPPEATALRGHAGDEERRNGDRRGEHRDPLRERGKQRQQPGDRDAAPAIAIGAGHAARARRHPRQQPGGQHQLKGERRRRPEIAVDEPDVERLPPDDERQCRQRRPEGEHRKKERAGGDHRCGDEHLRQQLAERDRLDHGTARITP